MIGKSISHYKILEKVGEGGMGEIYLAEDMNLGRKVAMKFLPKKFTADEGARERFKREARAAATLNHPNIVTIHEIDEYEDLLYIVMEYIEGETLGDKIKTEDVCFDDKTTPLQFMQINDIIAVILEVCKGLEKAHKAGIVHRDIKLENILIGKDGRVKILDFGLARLKGASKLTEESVAMGTAFYMSPEQLRGEAFDHRTDIWSLGVVMYAMITNQLPFQGKTALEIMYSILEKEPEPVSKLDKTIPLGFRRIVHRCLKKDPKKRYQDLSRLTTDLIRIKDNLISKKGEFKVKAGKTARADSFRGLFPKIAVPVVVLALVLALFFLVPSGSLKIKKILGFPIIPAKKHLALFPLAFKGESSMANRALCDGLVETFSRKLIRFEQFEKDLLVIPFSEFHSRDIKSVEEARQSFGVNLVITGDMVCGNENVRLTLNLIDTKKQHTLDSQGISKHISNLTDFQDDGIHQIARMMEIKLKPEMEQILTAGCTFVPGAYHLYLQARGHLQYFKKTENIDTAIGLFDRAIKIDSNYALAYAGLGEACYWKYMATKDIQWAENGKNYCSRAKKIDDRLVCVYITLGKIYKAVKQYDESLHAFQKALEIDPIHAEALRETARVYKALRNFDETKKAYQKAVRLRPTDSTVHNTLGVFYCQQSRWEDALKEFQEVVKLTPDFVKGLNNLGALYFYLKRRKDARQVFEHSLSIKPTYEAYSNLGTLYFHEGFYTHAIGMFKKALEKSDDDYLIRGFLAESYYWTPKQRDKSQPNYQRAAKMAEKALEKNPNDPEILSRLASYYGRMEVRSKTLSMLERVTAIKNLTPEVMFLIANTYEQIGEREKALQWIKSALDKDFSLAEIENNPGLSELRADSRFQEILQNRKERTSKRSETSETF
jgi:serine/threonine-protein kinase